MRRSAGNGSPALDGSQAAVALPDSTTAIIHVYTYMHMYLSIYTCQHAISDIHACIYVYIYIHICIYISRCIRDVQMKSKFRRMKILTLTNTYIYIHNLYFVYYIPSIIYHILYIIYIIFMDYLYCVYCIYIYTYMCLSILHLLPLHALLTCSNRCSMCRDISCRASVRRGCSLSLQCGFLSGKRACMT